MADTDAVSVSSSDDDAGDVTGATQIGASIQSEIAWTVGDTLPQAHVTYVEVAELPGDSYLSVTHEGLTESSGMDFALHQLTTATDLFDVPVIDFDSHSS
jgi:hypothetical protein